MDFTRTFHDHFKNKQNAKIHLVVSVSPEIKAKGLNQIPHNCTILRLFTPPTWRVAVINESGEAKHTKHCCQNMQVP